MARIRTIKPAFFTSEEIAELTPLERLLFIGLWTEADKLGRLADRPRELKVKLLPWDECDVDAMLTRLHELGHIRRYEAAGVRCIEIPGFGKHQKPHPKETDSGLPAPAQTASTAPSREISRQAVKGFSNIPSSPAGKGREGVLDLGREGVRATAPRPSVPDGGPEFYGWAQEQRTEAAGLIPEPPPAGFNAWWRDAHGAVNGDVERLRAGYRAFLTDRWARERNCPWAAWAKQWAKYVPPEQPRSEIRDLDGTEDLYPCEPPPEAA